MLDPTLESNIASTIGTNYEIICIDNSANDHSIFQAYNLGVARCRFPVICFMHDDIRYHTAGWGALVRNYFSDRSLGALGIAGSPYYPDVPGSWWAGGYVYETLIKNNGSEKYVATKSFKQAGALNQPVIVLDGVWLCIRKSLFGQIYFDESRFSGFHFYDIDICLQVYLSNHRLWCNAEILIEHFGEGNVNHNWIDNAIQLQQKWSGQLPAYVGRYGRRQKSLIAYKTMTEFVYVLMDNGIETEQAYRSAIRLYIRFSKIRDFWSIVCLGKFIFQYLGHKKMK
jgi:hypothetical protein